MNKDYYEILGVNKNATQDEIKKQYRILAKKHHPDKGGDEATFKEVNEAYQTLSDTQKRQHYDSFGNNQAHTPFWDRFYSNPHDGGTTHINLDEFFRHFNQPQCNRDLQILVDITLKESFFGKDVLAKFKTQKGTQNDIKIHIVKGVVTGTRLTVPNMGDDSIPHFPRGNLNIHVNVLPDNNFHRVDDDLCKIVEINPIEAIIGTQITIAHINGELINFNIKAGVANDAKFSRSGKGFNNIKTGNIGSLVCIVKIKPLVITDEKIIKQLTEINNEVVNNVK